MASVADLAKQRINILDIVVGEGIVGAVIEYQYKPKDGSPRTWHKTAITVGIDEDLYDKALNVATKAKAELEG